MTFALLALAAGAALAVLGLRHFFLVVTVVGMSMAPTLRPGQRLVLRRRRCAKLTVGDVVVFPAPVGAPRPPNWRIKRVSATAGSLFVPPASTGGAQPQVVPEGFIAVHGDNLAGSETTESLGFISVRDVAATLRGV